MKLPENKTPLIVAVLLSIIMLLAIYYTSIRPLLRKGDTRQPTDSNVVAELPTAKPIDIMGKGIGNKIEPVEEKEEVEAVAAAFEEERQAMADNEIPPEFDVDLFDNASDKERMERIMRLQDRYRQNNNDFAQEMARREIEEEKVAIQKEADTYRELYEQSISDNNQLAQRVQTAETTPQPKLHEREWLQVTTKRGEVVSTLGNAHSNGKENLNKSAFYGGGTKESSDEETTALRNALKATIQQTITVKDGDILPIRLTEDAYVGSTTLRAGTTVNGIVALNGNRLEVNITRIEYKGRIMEVKLTVFDLDAQKGIYVPDGGLMQTAKEATSALGEGVVQASTSGSQGYTINQSAKDAVIGTVARGAVAGIGSILRGKDRVPTVTIRSGYKLFLMNE